MRITILTLFPTMFDGFLENSIIKRALAKKCVSVDVVGIRSFTKDKYGRTDTPPIGGGAGLIEKCQPIVDALRSVRTPGSHAVLFSPRGGTYDEKKAQSYAKLDHLILVCGHYEGVDERVNHYVDELLSIGDYVLTGGEIPAMAVSDSVIRLLDGAIAKESLVDESFNAPLLEYPQYTEPADYEGLKVPPLLYTGDHGAIAKWRRKQSLDLTRKHRADLFGKLELTKQDKKLLAELDGGEAPKWETTALEKGKKFIKK
ncbi:MAG: tRNA (guanosine(37)-N1)-methyltransferase TrmD [Bacilli bacterium]|jgi:tRNA (guanine37-N1)-methyltransferase|nr:tRNA (guanosine(37)-N1)-methyltransferase TrmD [Bacilli bacterium]